MNQQSKDEVVQAGNRLIAEYMGRKFYAYNDNKSYKKSFSSYDKCQAWIDKIKAVGYKPELGWKQGCGDYHSSWDWLMPVVEKINTLAIDNEGEMGVYIKPNIVTIGENEHHPICMITIANHPTLIEMVWTCVVTFIRWYNSLTPTPTNNS